MESITINDILYVVLTAAVPLVLRFIYQLVSAKVEDTRYENAVNAVFSAVEYVNQVFVGDLKESGNFDETAQIQAFQKAKDAALDIMGETVRKWLDKTQVDVDEWLTVQIESAVKAVK